MRPLALVSGGPDSVALLRVLVMLGARPVVLHVDHGLRGEESRRDADFVRGLCRGLGLEFEVREPGLDAGAGLQERARTARYALARGAARDAGASSIVTGHTADDVAETVLMNLARGTGIRGLAGIPPVREGISRPLIERSRAEVLGYLEAIGQDYRTDSTNALPKYSRNRVRHEILPVLEELYPGAGANMARATRLLREDTQALEDLAVQALKRRGEELVIPPAGQLHAALRRHAARHAYSELSPETPSLDSAAVERVLALGEKAGGTLDLPSGVVAASRPGGETALYKRPAAPGPEVVLVEEGTLRLAGWEIVASYASMSSATPNEPPADAARPEVAYLDVEPGPYRLRLAREGDVVRPLGLGGGKKVLRAMMDRKVPRDLRRRTPVVVDARERVAWVAGGEIGEEFAVGALTRKALRLEVREPWRGQENAQET